MTIDDLKQDPAWQNTHEKILGLAVQLWKIHGPVAMTRESNGLHLNIASPIALERDGPVELRKRHLSINADKYLRIGKFKPDHRYQQLSKSKSKGYAQCMKYSRPYSMKELLSMLPLEERFPDADFEGFKITGQRDKSAWMVPWGDTGIKVPAPAGETVPLHQLTDKHTAIVYLRNRGFDTKHLEEKFNASYCIEEFPEDRAAGRVYRYLPCGFKDTPQGRLILEAWVEGVRIGWQARVLDFEVEDQGVRGKLYWQPYTKQWLMMEEWDEARQKFAPAPGVESDGLEWSISKYRTSTGAIRNELIMGLDYAVRWNKIHRPGLDPVCILAEGPLDAGKVYGPACAIIGAHVSPKQVAMVLTRFKRVVYVSDSDEKGLSVLAKARRAFTDAGLKQFVGIPLPPDENDPNKKVDLGSRTYAENAELLNRFLYES